MAPPELSILDACSPELQVSAAAKGWDRTNERDFQRAVEAASGGHSASVLLTHWPTVGAVDIVLSGEVGLELKWCKSGDTLVNCAWDIAKLGCAIAEGQLTAGFIAAGAPAAHWDGHGSGTELFAPRVYEDDDLARHYERWWRFWCRDVATRPVDLPRSVAVADEGSISTELDGMPFVLRLARVEVVDPAWRVHVCPHRWRSERCSPRPWDPDGWGGQPS